MRAVIVDIPLLKELRVVWGRGCDKHLAPDGAKAGEAGWLSLHDSHLIHQHISTSLVPFNARVAQQRELSR